MSLYLYLFAAEPGDEGQLLGDGEAELVQVQVLDFEANAVEGVSVFEDLVQAGCH